MKTKGVRTNKGFTIGELLIVIAIIGVLVAVGIPIFSAQTKKAKNATCMANVRSALGVCRTEQMTGSLDLSNSENIKILEKDVVSSCGGEISGGGVSGLCPEGGQYVIETDEDGNAAVTCTVHGDSVTSDTAKFVNLIRLNIGSLSRDVPGSSKKQNILTYFKKTPTGQVDSDASTYYKGAKTYTEIVKNYVSQSGIDTKCKISTFWGASSN